MNRPDIPVESDDLQENLRLGTRTQFQSEWTKVHYGAAQAVAFAHDLDEIPWVVDVIRSETVDGGSQVVVPSTDVTIVKTDTTITVTNDSTDTDYYFQVRAM